NVHWVAWADWTDRRDRCHKMLVNSRTDFGNGQENAFHCRGRNIVIAENRIERARIIVLNRPRRNGDRLARKIADILDWRPRRQNYRDHVPAQDDEGLPIYRRPHVAAHEGNVDTVVLQSLGAASKSGTGTASKWMCG